MASGQNQGGSERDAVTVITVTFNSAEVIGTCLASLPAEVAVIVVDNASRDGTAAGAEQRPGTRVLQLGTNVGFGAACNAGAKLAQTPYLLFLNPDATLRPETIEVLVAAARRYPHKSVFNPRILHDDGSLNLRAPSRFLGRAKGTRAKRPEADTAIDVLTGAAVFIRREAFEDIGGFDESIFLYFEDDDLSLRLLSAGYGLFHIHDAVVVHDGGTASLPSPALTRFKNYHWMRSYDYVARKHGEPLSRAPLIGLSAWRWLAAAVTLNGGERHKYEGRLKALIGR